MKPHHPTCDMDYDCNCEEGSDMQGHVYFRLHFEDESCETAGAILDRLKNFTVYVEQTNGSTGRYLLVGQPDDYPYDFTGHPIIVNPVDENGYPYGPVHTVDAAKVTVL